MLDDQALIVDVKGKGLVIVCGCAHAGVINTVKQAKMLSGSSNVYAVIGGFHLIKSSARRIKETIRELQREDLSLLIPGHCTGKKAISKFSIVFGEKCKRLRVGDKIVI